MGIAKKQNDRCVLNEKHPFEKMKRMITIPLLI